MASADVYTKVTADIIADLERGVRPWVAPWAGGSVGLPVRFNGQPYRGINVLLLLVSAIRNGFTASRWMTASQAARLGGTLRSGQRSSSVIFSKLLHVIDRTAEDWAGHEPRDKRDVMFTKIFEVYNVGQFEGLPVRYVPAAKPPKEPAALHAGAEAFCTAAGAVVIHGGTSAYYSPVLDEIHLPVPDTFDDVDSYVSTKAHELIHWTKGRLRRDLSSRRFGDTGYALEELVAELGAAFVCALLGISARPREDHASYVGHWLSVLKQDSRAIFRAAAHAQRAVDYLQTLQPQGDGARREA